MIKLDYKNDKPLHEQIEQGIKSLIINGILKKDEQLPSVRELSISLTVNPNTVQRAYRTLEAEGIINSIRGKGNFVAVVPNVDPRRLSDLYKTLKETVSELAYYGENLDKIQNEINETYKERRDIND